MPTTYEFVVETLDYYPGCGDDPDIIDTSGWPTLFEAERFARSQSEPWRIALRRDTGNEAEGLTERYYAYPDASGRLPLRMETCTGWNDGPDVPARYRAMQFLVMEETKR